MFTGLKWRFSHFVLWMLDESILSSALSCNSMLDPFLKQQYGGFFSASCWKLSISIQIYLQWVCFRAIQETWRRWRRDVCFLPSRQEEMKPVPWPGASTDRKQEFYSYFRNCQIILWHLVTRAFCSGKLHALRAQPEIPIKFPHAQNYAWLTCMAWPQQVCTTLKT